MATIVTRIGKGSPLTHVEVDNNFTGLNNELAQKEVAANKGVANGYASLDGGAKVPAAQLPSYVDDVIEAANFAALPVTGETGKIYVTLDTNKTYRWSGSAYVEISASPGSTDAVTEGSSNLYFTNARARAAVSASGSLSYDSSTGVMSFTDAVTSVAGKTGAVTLTNSDVGLGNVENKTSATIRGELTSGNVTTALGFTPYNSTNPSGYITSSGSITGSSGSCTGNAATAYGLNVHTGRNNEANKVVRTDGSGYLQTGYINSSNGDENNASSPARVWGTNGSDSYLRTYQTGSLSVGSATNATNGRYVYDNGAYSGGAAYREASSMHVYYAYLGRVVYNNGAYSGSGWVEPSDLGVRYANSCAISSQVTVNYNNNSASTYQMLWGSGNSVYGTGEIYCNPSTDYLFSGAFYCGNWFRSSGATGWYNESYGGGIYMEDATWVRTYGGKAFYCSNEIATAGNVTAYYSDERLKTNLGAISGALDAVKKLEGFRYVNNDIAKSFGYRSDKIQLGVSAQTVEALFPEIVTLAPFDMSEGVDGSVVSKSGENYKTLDYARLVPVLIEAIKELSSEVDSLKKQLSKEP